MSSSEFGDVVTLAALVRAGSTTVLQFRSRYALARCIGVSVAAEAGGLLVSSITVNGEEQLLGAGMPAELLGAEPVFFDRQEARGDGLAITLENHGADDTHAGVAVEFVEEQITAVAKVWN